jgi:hypothetical protein
MKSRRASRTCSPKEATRRPTPKRRGNVLAWRRPFPEALVADFDQFLPMCADLPDRGDHHVLAAALKAQAFALVTENLKHFPRSVLDPLSVEPRSTDDFLADTIALDRELAIAAIRNMRLRFKMPEMTTAEPLLVLMEAQGLIHTVDELRAHVHSL